MWIGIWPPSNVAGMRPRAFEPFVPRPAVLPFEPSPRPTRVGLVCEPGAGRRWCTLRGIQLLHFLDRDQVGHGLDHAADLRPVLLDDHVVDPLEAQRAQRLTLVLLVADPRSDLGDLEPGHVRYLARPAPAACPPERRPPAAARGVPLPPPAGRGSSE